MVSINCTTFNQESYIRQCLDGFVMQRTKFRFEAVVHDDASTDKTATIIKEYAERYPDIIRPIYETENQYSKHDGSLLRIMNEACKGKYIALCEGDDYWTDPYKLQKQVDFMEQHEDFSMCFHSAKVLNENKTVQYIDCEHLQEKEYFTKDIFPQWIIPTASVLCKREVLLRPIRKREMLLYGDISIFLSAADMGRLWGMEDQMSVYRIHSNGVTQTESVDYRKWLRHEKCLRMNFPKINRSMINNHISGYYYSLAKNDKRVSQQLLDYINSFFNSPKYFIGKVLKGIRRKLSGSQC